MVDLGTDVIPFRGAMPDAVRCMRTAFPGEAEGRNPRTPLSAAAAPHFRPNHREEEDGGGGGGEEAAERSDPVAVPSVPPLARDGPPSDRLLATEVFCGTFVPVPAGRSVDKEIRCKMRFENKY